MKRGTITLVKMTIFIVGILVLAMCLFWFPWVAVGAASINSKYAYLSLPVLVGLYLKASPFFL